MIRVSEQARLIERLTGEDGKVSLFFFVEEIPVIRKVKPIGVNDYRGTIDWEVSFKDEPVIRMASEIYAKKGDKVYFASIVMKGIPVMVTEILKPVTGGKLNRKRVRVLVDFQNPVFVETPVGHRFLLNDLSETGISFLINKSFIKEYPVGERMLFVLEIYGNKFPVLGDIVRHEQVNEKKIKVGVLLFNTNTKLLKNLSAYVLNKQRKIARQLSLLF